MDFSKPVVIAFSTGTFEYRVQQFLEIVIRRLQDCNPTPAEEELWNDYRSSDVQIAFSISTVNGLLANYKIEHSSGSDQIDSAAIAQFLRTMDSPLEPIPTGFPKFLNYVAWYRRRGYEGIHDNNHKFQKWQYASDSVVPKVKEVLMNKDWDKLVRKMKSHETEIGLVISRDGLLMEQVLLQSSGSKPLDEYILDKTSSLRFSALPDHFPDPVHIVIGIGRMSRISEKTYNFRSVGISED